MVHSSFQADNSKFGKVLREVMKSHHITGSDLAFCAHLHKEYIYAV